MVRIIDPQYEKYAEKMYPRIKQQLEGQFDTVYSSGTDAILNLPDDSSILYLPIHKSHLDYIILLADTFRQGLPFPRIVSGNNLLSGFTGAFIRYAARLDFDALGTLPIPRTQPIKPNPDDYTTGNSVEALAALKLASDKYEEEILKYNTERETFQQEFSSGLESGVLAIFPEAKEIDGGVKKTGRSYTGKERSFSPLFAREAVQKDNLYVVPMAITYDWIPETLLFEQLQQAKDQGKKKTYQALEAKAFAWDLWRSGHGDIHIKYGEPIKANDMKASNLVRESQRAAYQCVHPTDIMIACYVARDRTRKNEELTLDTIPVVGKTKEKQFQRMGLRKPRNINLRIQPYEKAQQFLMKKRILRKNRSGQVEIRNPFVLNHYANQVEHFFK